MAEDEAVVGKGDGRVRALSPDDDVGLEAAEVGCAIGAQKARWCHSVHVRGQGSEVCV